MSTPKRTVLIYGYGVMGHGVPKTFADAGFATLVKSSRAGKLEGLPAKTSVVERLPKEAPDLVIEFVPEDVPVKQAVYAELEAAYPGEAPLIATGTAGLDLVELARKMKRPERFLGVHYFMPADTAPVVEVMAGLATPRAKVDRVADALRRTGKEPVVLQADRRFSRQPPSARDPARSLLPDRSGRRFCRGHRPRRAAHARPAHEIGR